MRHEAAWWRWDQQDGETAGDITQGSTLPRLLDLPLFHPESLLQAMWLNVTGTGYSRRTGREGHRQTTRSPGGGPVAHGARARIT